MSSSSSRGAQRRRGGCERLVRRRVRVTVTVVTDHSLTEIEKELYARTFELAGASGSRVNGRLAAAEFRFLAESVPVACFEVVSRMSEVADYAAVLVVAGPAAGNPEMFLKTEDWPECPPARSVLNRDNTLVGVGTTQWEVL